MHFLLSLLLLQFLIGPARIQLKDIKGLKHKATRTHLYDPLCTSDGEIISKHTKKDLYSYIFSL
jgi:hypothetical protein